MQKFRVWNITFHVPQKLTKDRFQTPSLSQLLDWKTKKKGSKINLLKILRSPVYDNWKGRIFIIFEGLMRVRVCFVLFSLLKLFFSRIGNVNINRQIMSKVFFYHLLHIKLCIFFVSNPHGLTIHCRAIFTARKAKKIGSIFKL